MRSLARAFSSSRRAPPISTSKRCDSIVSISVTLWWPLRDSSGVPRRTVPRGDRIVEVGDHEALAELADEAVAELDHLGKVVPGVDVKERERQPGTTLSGEAESLARQVKDDAGVLAAGEQQRRALECGGRFAQDEDRLFLERVELGDVDLGQQPVDGSRCVHACVSTASVWSSGEPATCSPHSFTPCSHHQRPARASSPRLTARVQGAQPMLGKNWSCKAL